LRNKPYILSICVLAFSLALGSCAFRPNGVLTKRKMQALLIDLHRTDGVLQVIGYNYSHDEDVEAYYKWVLDQHGVTQAQFDSSLVWYTDHPLIFNRVYPKVLDKLQTEQQMYEAESAELLEARAQTRAAKEDGGWQKWIDEHTRPVEISLWEDPNSAENDLSEEQNVPFLKKNDEKTCGNEKKAVPLHPLSNKGDAMLLRQRD